MSETAQETVPDVRWLVATPRGTAPLFLRCPFHDDTGRSNYALYDDGGYCHRCGASESPEAVALRLGFATEDLQDLPRVTRNQRGALRSAYQNRRQDPESYVQAQINAHFYHLALLEVYPHRLRWLIDRALLPDTIRRWKLGHNGSWFTIPIWEGDRLHGIKLRSDPHYRGEGTDPKYMNIDVGVSIYRPNPRGRKLVITEGEYDALAVAQYGYDGVTTTAGVNAIHVLSRLTKTKKEVLIAVDNDKGGDEAVTDLSVIFPSAKRVRYSGKDITEFLRVIPLTQRRQALHAVLGGR